MQVRGKLFLVLVAMIAALAITALQQDTRHDLNSISRQHLELIPGIGPSLSSKIIFERNRKGGFRQMEDLLKIRGIGSNLLARLSMYLYIKKPVNSHKGEMQ